MKNENNLKMHIIKNTILLLICLLFWTTGNAQTETDTRRKSIGLKIGFDQTYFKDLNFSPLNYKGSGLVLDLDYRKKTKNDNLFLTRLDYSSTTLEASASEATQTDRYSAHVEFAYLKNLNLSKEKLNLHLGGKYHSYLDLSNFDDTEAVTFYAIHGLDITGLLSYDLNEKHHIQTEISIPVFGVFVRPPYTGWDKQLGEESGVAAVFKGDLTSLNDFFGINWTTNYQYAISPKWDLTAQYRFRYYRTEKLDLAKMAINQFSVGANLKF